MNKLLITGSNGFLAGHLANEAKKRGYYTQGLTRHIANNGNLLDNVYLGDMRDKELVEKAVNTADAVINIAGILGTQETVNNPYPSVEVNILGALNVFEACRIWKIPCIQIAVGNWWENNSYSITKTTAERFAVMYAKEHGVKINVVRALNAFGEKQKAKPVRKIIPSFITKALSNEKIQIYGDGQQSMDMVYVKDVANILLNVLENETTYGNTFEAGTGIGLSVTDIAKSVLKACHKPENMIEYLPMRPGESNHAVVVAKQPYKFDYTPFDEALEKTVLYYEKLKATNML